MLQMKGNFDEESFRYVVQKMNGKYEDKFPQARALYMYMYIHPGKKLNFMGNEICQLREWNEKREQDWHIFNVRIAKCPTSRQKAVRTGRTNWFVPNWTYGLLKS